MTAFTGKQFEGWSGGSWDPSAPADLGPVCIDTRVLEPGNTFVAIKGDRFDGHDFLNQAMDLGACAIVVDSSRAPVGNADRPVLRVDDTLAALQAIAGGYRSSMGARVTAVSGSAGKTTVKEMIAAVLSQGSAAGKTPGNLNNHIGVPLSLLGTRRSVDAAVYEIGINHPGEMAPLCSILSPDIGVITNVGPVHLEFFGSVDDIAVEKAVLLKSLGSEGVAVVNADSQGLEILRQAADCRLVTASLTDADSDYRMGKKGADGSFSVVDRATGTNTVLTPPVPGDHNIMNCLLAFAVGREYGLSGEEIAQGLTAYSKPPMRWVIDVVGDLTFVNDAYNANPLSMRAAIGAFSEQGGGKWLVLGDMLEIGETSEVEHRALGEWLAEREWAGLITVGEEARAIGDSARDSGMGGERIHECDDAASAAKLLKDECVESDCVLLKASRGLRLEEVRNQYALLLV